MTAAAALVAAVALGAGVGGCDDRRSGAGRSVFEQAIDREDDGTLSEPLLLALAQARNYHHLADVQLADGNPGAAIAAVEAILRVPFPPGAPEGEETILDARARLAKLFLGAGRLDDAERTVAEGLAGPHPDSFFLANLHAVAGEVHEARARALDGQDAAAAHAARRLAIEAFERSIQINERVQIRVAKEERP